MIQRGTGKIILPNKIRPGIYADQLISREPNLVHKISKSLNLEEAEIAAALSELIKFLYLTAYYNTSLSPSKRIDLMWHEFILFTHTYEQFCHFHFKRFIHHQPDIDTARNIRLYHKTKALYELNFGSAPLFYWPKAESCTSCGPCSTFNNS